MEYNVKAGEEDEPKCGAESVRLRKTEGVWCGGWEHREGAR